LITLWSYHPYQAFFAIVMEEVQRQAREHGYGLLVADAALRSAERQGGCAWPSDAILAMDCGPWSRRVLEARPSPQTPVVSMGTSLLPKTDSVRLDVGPAFAEATEHLIAQGCRRIAYFSLAFAEDCKPLAPMFAVPRDAYREVMERRGLGVEWIQLETATRADARQTVVEYVRRHGCPDGIICRNDDLAIGAYRAMCDLGLAVGDDVLLVGCDGIQDTQFLHCPLSTIVLPVAAMCEAAWKLLEARLADPSARRQQEVLAATLRVGQSSQQTFKKGKKGRASGCARTEIDRVARLAVKGSLPDGATDGTSD
jgi:LacI family transcriptional regulator